MQLRILPTLIAIATIFFTLVSASSKVYKGTATWYTNAASEGGDKGACWGTKIGDNDQIVALNREQYGSLSKNSKWCGKKVRITGPKGTATATIIDACPGCSYGDLDLSPVTFKKVVGKMSIGVGSIKWELA